MNITQQMIEASLIMIDNELDYLTDEQARALGLPANHTIVNTQAGAWIVDYSESCNIDAMKKIAFVTY